MLTHQAADLLVINDQALLAKRSLDATPAIVLELVADSGDRLNDRGIIGRLLRAVILSRARNPHQPTSFRDGEASGAGDCHSACNIGSDAVLVQLRLLCAD
ncbi:hypothetical protein CT676_43415 [Bradyrhizobium sp. MOS001]|uniref:hypothetical protein n=1 Tax=Bradyrhizobium sp. MOS001 TaxID=2133948 RepID=UPI001074AAAE|nr:hypothetical protein [Bradyrhizobium sp. MOS001]TFW51367.1 hypothetical protein CT676_43415 [Bradyrhizobium sp. MOS001]